MNELLENLLPQSFDSVVSAIRTALYQIDPSWQKGQFDFFSKHFHMNLVRSCFTKRITIYTSKVSMLTQEQILKRILQASQNLDDNKKASFYGKLLSEYILFCPKERFPAWAEPYKEKPN